MFQTTSEECRFCNSKIETIKNLGNLYSCGIFPESTETEVDSGVLAIGICPKCELVQLLENYDHNKLYTESYGYRSSLNESMEKHLATIAYEIHQFMQENSLEVEGNQLDIGSNDATLINQVRQYSQDSGLKINQIGVDPSGSGFRKFYKHAELIEEPFQKSLATSLEVKFSVISSIAMFYDLQDPKDFVLGIKHVLANNGVWISEQSYIFRMFEQNAFDTICQEHLEYYSISDIVNLCDSADLELFDVKFNDINGGSFRFYVQHKNGPRVKTNELQKAISTEETRNKRSELLMMFDEVEKLKGNLKGYLMDCKLEGLEIHGYGASTKGNTLLQFFGIGPELISCIAERNESKYGKFTPGTQIPIVSEAQSKNLKPHAYLVLPWHFKDAILERELQFREFTSTKFIFPLPNFEVV
jgi:hypothetical protein